MMARDASPVRSARRSVVEPRSSSFGGPRWLGLMDGARVDQAASGPCAVRT